MKSYRERLITAAASMAVNILADSDGAKTEKARRELVDQAYNLLNYALVPDSARPMEEITPEIKALLKEVGLPQELKLPPGITIDDLTVDLDADLTNIPVDAETEARIDRVISAGTANF